MGSGSSAGLNIALESASVDELKTVIAALSDEQRQKVIEALKASESPPTYESTKNSFKFLKWKLAIDFAEAKSRTDWWKPKQGEWKCEQSQEDRPNGPQKGDRRSMDAEFPGVGHVKVKEECLEFSCTDDKFQIKILLLENSLFKPTPITIVLTIEKDSENQVFIDYQMTWESGEEFTETEIAIVSNVRYGIYAK
mmetsp:Transcript_85239/g.134068  ORF Transcript_85239/g.134068 Transcript_85239/m.134068 type:complete len:195 (+) Transcript_85239:81-665(+)|eukprot:CAMPEP_0169208634 /NCGR_PEP_ID=MMETSP1016-20121227/14236_1 /TAXON_ID=342587 /ORGANISM="Karlodinium micrum, Strain CCMP2283" /LENGTH=194 /DNA_ID=CAMNT_0009286021 /DNA_START=80 /DNA_END=664 /DNA_ORIENTATION=+